MKKKIRIPGLVIVLLSGMISKSNAQPLYGSFEQGMDIGEVKKHGACAYDANTEKYVLKGSGTNIWTHGDEFYFVWKHMEGNFILDTHMEWIGKGVEANRKGGLIIRESLEPGARYIDIAFHGKGLMSMQYRDVKDSATKEITSSLKAAPNLQMEKAGDKIITRVAANGEPLSNIGELEMKFDKGYYVGLYVCAHNPNVMESAVFTNTRLTIPPKEGYVPYKDYIGCRLEIMDIETGLRKVIYQSQQPFEAPNWSKDGKFLILNSKGLIYRIPAEGGKPEIVNTGIATNNNNDHGISPDGKLLVISNHLSDRLAGDNSVIFTLPVEGGTPKQITDKSPSYWHGWSPDGKYLVYAGKRNNQFDIYRIPAIGGNEVQLTNSPSLNDGPEYSPDGKYIWFNSSRTGTMHIWRMNADGSEPVQITTGNLNNWFAHPSPDGKHVVFISFPKEVSSTDHPYYKHVLLQLLDISNLNPRVIAYVFGGQGTINVPSWSPDGKKFAFISNSGE
jgi:Tol biopolymer transport system component